MKHLLDWNDLKVLVAVAEQGNLKKAAQELGVNPSTVWRKIQALEQQLGSQMLAGDRGGYQVTANGLLVIEHARKMAAHADAIQLQACATHLEVRGLIRVTAPSNLAWEVLPPLMQKFQQRHPDVTFELTENAAPLDIGKQEADIALRGTREAPDDTIAHFLRTVRWGVYAAPGLTSATSLTVEELFQLPFIGYSQVQNSAVRWLDRYGRQAHVPVRCNSILTAYQCAVKGMGLVCLPENQQWALNSLYFLPPEYDSGLWILTHPEMRNAARIRAFWDFLIEELSLHYKVGQGPVDSDPEHDERTSALWTAT